MKVVDWTMVKRVTDGVEVHYAKKGSSWSKWQGKIEKRFADHAPVFEYYAFVAGEHKVFASHQLEEAKRYVEAMI